MTRHLRPVPSTGASALPLVVTGAVVSVPGGLAFEVVPDGDRVVAQAEHLIAWLRANNAAMSRLWSAVLADEHQPAAVAVLSSWLLDAQRLELTPADADALADDLSTGAQAAATADPAEITAWAAADAAVTAALEGRTP